jgi:hypothetical protein
MKISGIPGRKDMVLVFDPDEVEKVRRFTWRMLAYRYEYT